MNSGFCSVGKKKKGYIYGGYGTNGLVGVNSYRVTSPKFLRFCRVCRELDLDKFGETYWHRKHQLPGALVCPEHAIPLINSSALIQPLQTQYTDATIFTLDVPTGDEYLNEKELFLAEKIAVRCQNILTKKDTPWHGDNLGTAYRQAALQRGFCKIPGIFSSKKFESAFLEFYGESLLEKVGINPKSKWIPTIFYDNNRQPVHPLEHILVQIFLEQMPVVASSKPFGQGPWRCPNPFGAHEDSFPIKKIYIRTNRSLEVVACARCTCGFFFTFQKTDSKDRHLPIVKKIWKYGPSWKKKTESLIAAGMSLIEVSKAMSLPVQRINVLLKFESRRDSHIVRDIESARNDWLQKLEQAPNRSVREARKKNYGLYQFLRKYDHEWMMKQRRPRQSKTDWADRDTEWSLMLQDAALKIAKNDPNRRIAKTAMIKEAGLNLRLMNELYRLPKCESMLNNLSESRHSYRHRLEKKNLLHE